jgi:hypothetical protein
MGKRADLGLLFLWIWVVVMGLWGYGGYGGYEVPIAIGMGLWGLWGLWG